MSMFVFMCVCVCAYVCVRKCLHLQAYVCDEMWGKNIYE